MRSGTSIRNNLTGESLTVFVSEDDTAGARQLYEVYLPPQRPSPPRHYHLGFTETFSVLEGALDLFLDRELRHVTLHPGESLTVQLRQIHTFANLRDTPTRITVDTRPAGGVVRAFQIVYGIANNGGSAPDGLPQNPLARLIFIRTTQGYLPQIPLLLQKTIFAVANIIAHLTGLHRRLSRYYS
jgi:mannose-6-phosphate isomerase-like protein (cupin superfamily)